MGASDTSEAEPTMTIGPWVVVPGIPRNGKRSWRPGCQNANPGDEDEPPAMVPSRTPRRGRECRTAPGE